MKKEQLPLSQLQKWMQTVLVHPLGTKQAPYKLLPTAFQGNIEQVINPSSRLSARARLAIYQRGYLARLRHCMAEQFTALSYALGADLFQAFTDQYLQVYPSQSYTLADLGNNFIHYLQATRPDKDAPPEEREDWPDFMIELVQFELAVNSIFDRIVKKEQIATSQTAEEQLLLNPCLEIFSFQFPTLAYYQAFKDGLAPTLPFPKASFAALNRHQFKMGAFHLNEAQFHFLMVLKTGKSILEAQTDLGTIFQLPMERVLFLWGQWKEVWLAAGFFWVNSYDKDI